MREILFRGKRMDNGDWYEGVDVMHKTVRGELCLANVGEDWVSVDPLTFGQFTGLNDKNGKRIFEGDIIETTNPYTGEEYVGVVEWGCYYTFGVGFVIVWNIDDNDLNPSLFYWVIDVGVEVVGNAYDNPELLENNTRKDKSI